MKYRLGMALIALPLACPGVLLVLRAQEELPDGEGKKVVERVCTECHGTDEITSIKRTPDQWRRVVTDMLDRRDTKTSDEEVKQIVEYLIAHFSRPAGVQAAHQAVSEEKRP
jgi:cytochrome c1